MQDEGEPTTNCEAPGASNSEGLFITTRREWNKGENSNQHPGAVTIGGESQPTCSNSAGGSQTLLSHPPPIPHWYHPLDESSWKLGGGDKVPVDWSMRVSSSCSQAEEGQRVSGEYPAAYG